MLRTFEVDTLYVARVSNDAPAYTRLRTVAAHVPVRELVLGDRIRLAPGYEARVLWPQDSDSLFSGANGLSVVLWARGVRHPDVLAMGDLEADGEERLLRHWRTDLEAARGEFLVLKAGHHGSDTSSTAEFLDAVDAEVALVSAGRRNRYGHPSAETLEALRSRHAHVLRTDRHGAVRLLQRGTTVWVERPGLRPQALGLVSPAQN